MKILWTNELETIREKLPCWFTRFLIPKIIVLPQWLFKGKYGAWTYFNYILITPSLLHCPTNVRRYILGHEYGHIFGGHIYLQYVWLLAALLYIFGILTPIMSITFIAILIKSIVFYVLTNPRLGAKREIYADSISADLFSPVIALEGSTWMANTVGDLQSNERQLRLSKLISRVNP